MNKKRRFKVISVLVLSSLLTNMAFAVSSSVGVSLELQPGEITLNAPTSISLPNTTVSRDEQEIILSAGDFSVEDLKSADTWYYATISVGNITWAGEAIPAENVYMKLNGQSVVTEAWTDTGKVVIPSSILSQTYFPINNAVTIIDRNESVSGAIGKYKVTPELKVKIPAYQQPGSYSGTITYTLIERG